MFLSQTVNHVGYEIEKGIVSLPLKAQSAYIHDQHAPNGRLGRR
jgi:hypothetical protein